MLIENEKFDGSHGSHQKGREGLPLPTRKIPHGDIQLIFQSRFREWAFPDRPLLRFLLMPKPRL